MGIAKSRQLTLTSYELQDFADQTQLSFEEVEHLYRLFRTLSVISKDDGVIDFSEFSWALGSSSESIFKVLDLNNDAVLNFREFVLGLSMFLTQSQAQQIKFLFSLIDHDQSNELTEEKVVQTIIKLLKGFPQIVLSEEQITLMVKKEFDHIFESTNSMIFSSVSAEPIQMNDEVGLESPVKRIPKVQSALSIPGKRSLNFAMFHQIMVQNDYLLQWLQINKELLKQAACGLLK